MAIRPSKPPRPLASRPAARTRAHLPYWILFTGLALTAVATVLVDRVAEQQDHAAFDSAVNLSSASMDRRITAYCNLVRSTGQAFYLTTTGGPATFYKFVEGLDIKHDYPGIAAVGASIKLPEQPAARKKLLTQLHKHVPGYKLWPPGPRAEFHTIFAIYPLDRVNKRAIGYDMHTDPVRADAMDRARDSGRLAASERVVLVQDEHTSPQPAFMIFYPLYTEGILPPPGIERTRRLVGFSYAPFRFREAFLGLVSPSVSRPIAFEIDDITGGRAVGLFRSVESPRGQVFRPRFSRIVNLKVADRRWRVSFVARPGFREGRGLALTLVLAVAGAAISSLLFGITRNQHRAQQALEERQRNIEVLNEQLRHAMRETHHRVKNSLQIIAAMIDMQAMEADPHSRAELQRLAIHIGGLAAVHDILTDQARIGGDTEHISARKMLEKLLPMLAPLAMGRPLVTRLDDALLTSRQGTSLAIVTNELVSNSIKHGRGPVEVAFSARNGTATLQVSDDGPGFPRDFDSARAANTGLQLVGNLSEWDLGGGVRFENRPQGGARVTVEVALHASHEEAKKPLDKSMRT